MGTTTVLFAVLVITAVSGQSVFLREMVVPLGSINQLGNWIQQVPRADFLDCPTNENRFGVSCDPAATSRDDLDNYFCGSNPNDFGWCGSYWKLMTNREAWPSTLTKRGVSNGALPIPTTGGLPEEDYKMYLEMFGRVCSCHCGCAVGCSDDMEQTSANNLFCGGQSGSSLGTVGFPTDSTPLQPLALVREFESLDQQAFVLGAKRGGVMGAFNRGSSIARINLETNEVTPIKNVGAVGVYNAASMILSEDGTVWLAGFDYLELENYNNTHHYNHFFLQLSTVDSNSGQIHHLPSIAVSDVNFQAFIDSSVCPITTPGYELQGYRLGDGIIVGNTIQLLLGYDCDPETSDYRFFADFMATLEVNMDDGSVSVHSASVVLDFDPNSINVETRNPILAHTSYGTLLAYVAEVYELGRGGPVNAELQLLHYDPVSRVVGAKFWSWSLPTTYFYNELFSFHQLDDNTFDFSGFFRSSEGFFERSKKRSAPERGSSLDGAATRFTASMDYGAVPESSFARDFDGYVVESFLSA